MTRDFIDINGSSGLGAGAASSRLAGLSVMERASVMSHPSVPRDIRSRGPRAAASISIGPSAAVAFCTGTLLTRPASDIVGAHHSGWTGAALAGS